MQMYSENALRWVISAILLFPLPYNGPLQIFNISELRDEMIRMCPRFSLHYLAQLQSQKPQVLMAIFFTRHPCQLLTRRSDSLGPTVHAHAQSICLCLFECHWKALVKPDVPKKIFSATESEGQRETESDGETRIYIILMKQWQKGGCDTNGRIVGWQLWVSTVALTPCIN